MSYTELGEDNSNTEANLMLIEKWPQITSYYKQINIDYEKQNITLKCLLCCPKENIISTSLKSNSNLRKHIKNVHPLQLTKYNNLWKKRKFYDINSINNTKMTQTTLTETYSKQKLTQKMFNRANLELIVSTVSPFSFIEHPAFIKYCKDVVNMTPVSRKTLMRDVNTCFIDMKEVMIETLNCVEYVCVTADCWTSFKRAFIGFTVHWIDPQTMQRKLNALACRRIMGSHSYDKLAEVIEQVLIEFNIQSKTTRLVTDNASNFAKAFRTFGVSEFDNDTENSENIYDNENKVAIEMLESEYTEDIFDTLTDGELLYYRLPIQHRCAAHTLNLLATTDIENLQKTQGPFRNISRKTFGKFQQLFNKQHQSSLAADKIKNVLGRYLIVPNAKRWNAFYDALSFMVMNLEKINMICIDLSIPCLATIETNFLIEYCKVMKPIAKSLDILQGDKIVSIGYLIPTLCAIKKSLNNMKAERQLEYCLPLVDILLNKINTRFESVFESDDLKMAAMLIPKFKWYWADVNTVPLLKELFKKKILPFVQETSPPTTSTHIESNNDDDDFLSFNNCVTNISYNNDDELIKIINEYSKLPTSLDVSEIHQKCLRKAFMKYNTAVPSSAHIELLFSASGKLLSESELIADHDIEKLLLLKFNKYFL